MKVSLTTRISVRLQSSEVINDAACIYITDNINNLNALEIRAQLFQHPTMSLLQIGGYFTTFTLSVEHCCRPEDDFETDRVVK